jgi:hypothetical protein
MIFPPLGGQYLGGFNIAVLAGFIATTQQNSDYRTLLDEINPVARAIVDAHFGNTFADWFNVAGIAKCQSIYPGQNAGACPDIPQILQPAIERIAFDDFNHDEV